jgi:hypothetical protein
MAVDSQVFPQSALEDNRQGRLTDAQRKLIRTLCRGTRKSELTVATFAAVFGIFLFFAVRSSTPALERVGIPIGCLALAAFLLFRAITGGDRLTRDLRHPRVASLEGPIGKHAVSTGSEGGSSSTIHYLDVAGQRFEVGRHAYQEAPEAGFVRIYFLSISRHVVNLERLPDHSLPEGTTPRTLVHEFKDAMLSHDRVKLDELRAEMAGTVNALQAGISHDVAPPEESRDQRPLAEVIQGTWSNGPVTVTFTRKGTFSIMMLGANERSGHWTVSGDGKLMADFGGRSGPVEAWVVGDQLTVSFEGTAITLKRTSD